MAFLSMPQGMFGRGFLPNRQPGDLVPDQGGQFPQSAPVQDAQPNKWARWGNSLGRVGAAFHTDPSVLQNYDQNEQQQAYQREQARLLQQKVLQDQYKLEHPDAPQPTELQRNFQWFQGLDPQSQQAVGQFEDMHNPRYTNTPQGTVMVPRTSGGLPQGYDPKEWEVVPGPQASPQAAPQMPQGYSGPTPEQMHNLYRQQFGPRGEAMYQEWLRNSGGR